MEKVESTITQETSWVDTSLEVDQQLEEEQKNGYTWEESLIVQNPYRYSPLTAVILFDTDEECEVRVTVKGKTEAADIEGTIDAATSHRVPVVGLYAGQENTVLLELLDDAGKVTDSQEVKITTDELPEKMSNAVTPVKTSGESALPLTIVHGQGARYPYAYAYDCMGDVRWYLDRKSDKFGIYRCQMTDSFWQQEILVSRISEGRIHPIYMKQIILVVHINCIIYSRGYIMILRKKNRAEICLS